MSKESYGTVCGQKIDKYTLFNDRVRAQIITYGATLTGLWVPDKNGRRINVVTGYDSLQGYVNGKDYRGSIIGRYANRIGRGKFSIDEACFQVSTNEGCHTLHGGQTGFDKRIWSVLYHNDQKLTLFYHSPDAEEGFPGAVDVTVQYSVTDEGGLSVFYMAIPYGDTVLNLTNHSYFNLNGSSGPAKDQLLQIHADYFTPVDNQLIPHNDLAPVKHSAYDFSAFRSMDVPADASGVLKDRGCYDENFALLGDGLRQVARLASAHSGIEMEVITDQPGLQLYTGDTFGIALETQNFPNALNCPSFPSGIYRAGQIYHTTTMYRFGIYQI